MFWLKCCPKCGGDLYEDRDPYGRYTSCVQCGHYLTEAEEVLLKYAVRIRAMEARKRVAAREPAEAGKTA